MRLIRKKPYRIIRVGDRGVRLTIGMKLRSAGTYEEGQILYWHAHETGDFMLSHKKQKSRLLFDAGSEIKKIATFFGVYVCSTLRDMCGLFEGQEYRLYLDDQNQIIIVLGGRPIS